MTDVWYSGRLRLFGKMQTNGEIVVTRDEGVVTPFYTPGYQFLPRPCDEGHFLSEDELLVYKLEGRL